jgi:hypothetical protein
MKKLIIALLVLGGAFTSANAYYSGMSGTKYQYDMSKPIDRMHYNMDLDAQRRDQMNINPNVGLDKGVGQVGGGVYR